MAQTKTATTATLSLTSGGAAVTSVVSGSIVTLTATVNAGAAAVKQGQVNFCDVSAKSCTDIHLLGTAQLTSAGTATLKFRPGTGSHSYNAVFLGTRTYSSGSSNSSSLTVTGTTPTLASTTTIARTGSWGQYALSATVKESGGTLPPTGSVSFLDTSNGNSVLQMVALGPSVAGIDWPNPQGLTTNTGSQAVALGDFNDDGIPDIAAVAGGTSRPLVILLGNANGTYTTAPAPAISAYTFGPIVVADFNGDGKQDLAILNGDNSAVTVLLGNGDGTFPTGPTTQTQVSVDYSSAYMIAGDFNGDGMIDMVLLSFSIPTFADSVTTFLGTGDGTFTASATSLVLNQGPVGGDYIQGSMIAADFNGDGKMDLAVVGDYVGIGGVTILLGN